MSTDISASLARLRQELLLHPEDESCREFDQFVADLRAVLDYVAALERVAEAAKAVVPLFYGSEVDRLDAALSSLPRKDTP